MFNMSDALEAVVGSDGGIFLQIKSWYIAMINMVMPYGLYIFGVFMVWLIARLFFRKLVGIYNSDYNRSKRGDFKGSGIEVSDESYDEYEEEELEGNDEGWDDY